jgi:DHA1 family tetracycline resistance protein-like MFS transporter
MSFIRLFTLYLVGFVDHFGIGLVYPLFAVFLFDPQFNFVQADTSLAMRGTLLGILLGLTPFIKFLSSPFLGAFSDGQGRKKTLSLGVATGFLGYVFAILGVFQESLIILFVYRILVGLSDGTAPVALASLSDMSTSKNKASRFAFFSASLGFGFSLGPFLGGKLADQSFGQYCSFVTPFFVACGLSALNLLLIMILIPETKKTKKEASFSIKDWLKNFTQIGKWTSLHAIFIGGFACSFAWSFFHEFIPVYLTKEFSFTTSHIGNYYGASGLWYAIGSGLIVPPLLKRFSPEQLICKAFFLCSLSMFSFLFVQEGSWIFGLVPLLMINLAIIYPTATAIVSNNTDESIQGEVLGIFTSILAAAMGISPLFFGTLVGLYPSVTVIFGGLVMFFGGWYLWKDKKSQVLA